VGDLAPNFELRDSDGVNTTLHELVTEMPAILLFYRGDW
jgi:peroxiredoxin